MTLHKPAAVWARGALLMLFILWCGATLPAQNTAAQALELARRYESLSEWDRAEAQYLEAYKSNDKNIRTDALTGIERVRRRGQAFEASLALAARYEELKEWEKAEEQFAEAGKSSNPDVAEKGREGVKRMRKKLRSAKEETALSIAQDYEKHGLLQQAEQQFLEAAKSDRVDIVRQAIEGLRRTRESPRVTSLATTLDRWAGHAGRSLGVLLVFVSVVSAVILVMTVARVRRSIRVVALQGDNDDRTKQLMFWLASVRSHLRLAVNPPTGGILTAGSPTALPYIELPDLPGEFEQIEELEFGGTKVPLQQILRLVQRPRVQITGQWVNGDSAIPVNGRAHAAVERRHGWWRYRTAASVDHPIGPAAGAAQDDDLELFAYAILLEAVYVHVS